MRRQLAALIVIGLAGAGCAAQTAGLDDRAPSTATAAPAPAAYKLTEDEEKLDCPRLTGSMKVRIAQMRGSAAGRSSTVTSRTLQTAVTPVLGGTSRGLDPDADMQRDRARLEALNRRLAEKKCKTLDIDAELGGETTPAPPPKRS